MSSAMSARTYGELSDWPVSSATRSGTPRSSRWVESPMSRLSNRTTWKPSSASAWQKPSGHMIIWLATPITSTSGRVVGGPERLVGQLDLARVH